MCVRMATVITVTTQPVEDPQVPTPSHYDDVSAQLMAALDAFAGAIPKLEESEIADAKQVRKNLNVPEAFCYTAIAAAEQLPELEVAKRQYAEKNRNRLQYIAAVSPLADKLVTVLRRLTHGLRANKSAVGGDSLEIYRLVRALLKNTRNPAVAAHSDALQRDLAKKSLTKEEREKRKAKKLNDLIEQAIAERAAQGILTIHPQKEVKAA